MANPGRTRPASLGPIDPDEPPIPQIFPKLQREADSYGAGDEDVDYVAAVHAIIEDARDFNESYLAPAREYAAALYNGELPEAADAGRSSIVLTEVRDLVLAMLPSLVRLFTSPEHPCYFSPRTEADVAMAEEAQDYVSYVWKYDNPGFLNLNAILKDALIKRTGIVKWWTEREAEVVELQYRGLTLEQRQYVISQPRTQVVKEERRDSPKIEGAAPGQPTVGPPGPTEGVGPPGPPLGPGGPPAGMGKVIEPRFDLTVRRFKLTPKHRIAAVPPDEFRISREARDVPSAALVGQERLVPLSQLILMGYPAGDIADEYGGSSSHWSTAEEDARSPGGRGVMLASARSAAEGDPLIWYGEWFIRIDKDGDGVPELRRICTMGDGDTIVSDEPAARVKFAVFCPDPEPHAAIGHAIGEQVEDLQNIKTNILRNFLDSLASTILPRLVVVDTMANMDDVRNNELGSIIRVKQADAVTQLQTTPPSQVVQQVMEYLDLIGTRRTGVTEQSKGLDPKALQSTATPAVQMLVTGAQERIELVARTLAETGFRDLFKGLLQEIVENPIPERMIRLRGKWTKVTPDQYDATMDCEVNPAIGKGSDQDRLTMLMGIKQTQEAIIQSQGAANPMCGPMEYRNTLEDIMSINGMKNVSRYFKQIDQQQLAAALKAQSEKPDPNMVLAQAEADKVRAQIVKTLTDAKVKTIEMGLKDDLERDKLDADIAVKGGELATKGFELDQNAVQMAIDATRPEAEKSSTENIPEPGPPMFPQPEPIQPPDAPAAPPGPPGPPTPLLRPPGAPPKLDLPSGFGQR
jgi:hypothetical protein